MDKETQTKMIEEVLNDFDFEKAVKVMRFLNWEWIDPNFKTAIPSIYQIVSNARLLLISACENYKGKSINVCGGGFRADIDEKGTLTLSFVVTSTDAYPFDSMREMVECL